MEKGVAEILDGYSIALIKNQKISTLTTNKIFIAYKKGLDELKTKYPEIDWDTVVKPFISVNTTIWKYEAAIRQGLVDDDPTIVASRAILVREFNQVRVGLGNVVSAMLGEIEHLNVKKEHVSE